MSRYGNADLPEIHAAGVAMLTGHSPYAPTLFPFTYPPGSLLLLWPMGLAPFKGAAAAFTVLQAVLIVVAVLVCLRTFRVPAWSSRAALAGLGVLLLSATSSTLWVGNPEAILLLGESVALLLWSRAGWSAGAALLGATLAFKPTLAPLLSLPALHRRPAALALAVTVPLALSALALALDPAASAYFRDALPYLSSAERGKFIGNDSLLGTSRLLGVAAVGPILAIAVVAIAGFALYPHLARRRTDALTLTVIAAVGLEVFFLGGFCLAHYPLLLVPLLVSGLVPGSPLRTWPGALGTLLMGSPDLELWRHGILVPGAQVRITAGLLLLFLTCCWWLRRGAQGPAPADQLDQREAGTGQQKTAQRVDQVMLAEVDDAERDAYHPAAQGQRGAPAEEA